MSSSKNEMEFPGANNLMPPSNCRICGSCSVQFVSNIRPHLNYSVAVFDCNKCGCRFVEHDPSAHEKLHSTVSSYAFHNMIAEHASHYFENGQIQRLRQYLRQVPKYRFVIDTLDAHNELSKVAEIGCSLGYLASYFIASDREMYGFDISETAVCEASRRFGEHFYMANTETLKANGPYDAIYHVGTIGCVESPLEMTDFLLSVLKPGGLLIFNAPNRRYLDQTGELWVDTLPPDLVTIFPKIFWEQYLSKVADVSTKEVKLSLWEWLQLLIKKQRKKMLSNQNELHMVDEHFTGSAKRRSSVKWAIRHLLAPVIKASLGQIRSHIVDPYGVFVVVRKRAVK